MVSSCSTPSDAYIQQPPDTGSKDEQDVRKILLALEKCMKTLLDDVGIQVMQNITKLGEFHYFNAHCAAQQKHLKKNCCSIELQIRKIEKIIVRVQLKWNLLITVMPRVMHRTFIKYYKTKNKIVEC